MSVNTEWTEQNDFEGRGRERFNGELRLEGFDRISEEKKH
jgi:hypothetical protein